MDSAAEKWLDYAEGDLEAAETLLEHPRSHRSWELVIFHCHEAIEKVLKTVLVQQGKEVKKIHDLSRLHELTGIELLSEHTAYIDELNPYYPRQRYPDVPAHIPLLRNDKETAAYHFKKSKELLLWIKNHFLT